MAKQKTYIYAFEDAFGQSREILGGKGAGLAEMMHAGIPIPQGFTITTEACNLYYDNGKVIPQFLIDDIIEHVHRVEKESGKKFGGDKDPLLFSVRSGARVSMPGMMDTILNLGLNPTTVQALIDKTG
ncbi:MAG: pyruvate, phosphate dikinase, partial [Coprobacillus sp.]|nr:pyruvate, phosphate dikinase [Coprobacillus sp.]